MGANQVGFPGVVIDGRAVGQHYRSVELQMLPRNLWGEGAVGPPRGDGEAAAVGDEVADGRPVFRRYRVFRII